MDNILNIPEQYKGKNKTTFCISLFLNTNVLLLSYKNGNTILCQLVE
jgi:hypothetical protein